MKYSVSLDSKDWDFIWSALHSLYEGCEDDEALKGSYKKSREIMRKLDLADARAQKRAQNLEAKRLAKMDEVDHSEAEAIIARKLGA